MVESFTTELARLEIPAAVHHIGATSLPFGHTKGDVDVNVRVDRAHFPGLVDALSLRLAIAQPEHWTPTFASFSTPVYALPLGVQVTVAGSSEDFLLALRDRLRDDPDLLQRYDEAKVARRRPRSRRLLAGQGSPPAPAATALSLRPPGDDRGAGRAPSVVLPARSGPSEIRDLGERSLARRPEDGCSSLRAALGWPREAPARRRPARPRRRFAGAARCRRLPSDRPRLPRASRSSSRPRSSSPAPTPGSACAQIDWLGWGSAVAAGVGTAFANDCTPNCAAGHFHTYRAVLVLSGSQRCGGDLAYRTATVAIVGSPPAAWSTAADATYPLRCA